MSDPRRLLLAGTGLLLVTLGVLSTAISESYGDTGNSFGLGVWLLVPAVCLLGIAAGGSRTSQGCTVNVVGILGLWLTCWITEPDAALYFGTPLASFAMGVVLISAVLWHYPGDTRRELLAGRAAFAFGAFLILGSLVGVVWLFVMFNRAFGVADLSPQLRRLLSPQFEQHRVRLVTVGAFPDRVLRDRNLYRSGTGGTAVHMRTLSTLGIHSRKVLVAALMASCLGYVMPPSAARADEVAVAQARVDSLQAVATATTQQLVEGTRQWEADVRALRQVEMRLGNVRRSVEAAQQEADAGQERLDHMARRLYTRGTQSSFNFAMTREPEAVLAAAHDVLLVQRAMGATEDVIAQAAASRQRLRQQQSQVEELATRADELTRRSAQRIANLQSTATRMAAELDQAQAALQSARQRKAAAIAAAAAARREAALERALRAKAAARERAARERAVPARPTGNGGQECTGKSTEGQANGNLDPESLCDLWQAPGHRLRADAAAAFNRMSKHHASTRGGPLCVTDSYRSYSEQVDVYNRKPGLAAVPGTSEHGWGKAVDLCGGVQNFGTAAYEWMKANAPRFGWFHPEWAEPSGSKPEAWHWEFSG